MTTQREDVASLASAVEDVHLRALNAALEVKRAMYQGLVHEESERDALATLAAVSEQLDELTNRIAERNSMQRVANDIGGAA